MKSNAVNQVAEKSEETRELFAKVKELRVDCAKQQKKGLHFILTSVIIWMIIFVIQLLPLSMTMKNMLTFCSSALMFPIAVRISRLIKADFQGKGNPLTSLGILFTMNQAVYLLIAMWTYYSVPDKLVMVYAMIFGAHLLPYGWLYLSKSYFVFSGVIPVLALLLGLYYPAMVVAGVMVFVEIVFCICLVLEVQKLEHGKEN